MRFNVNSNEGFIYPATYVHTCDVVALHDGVRTTLYKVNTVLGAVIYIVVTNITVVVYCGIAINTPTESFNAVAGYSNTIILDSNART